MGPGSEMQLVEGGALAIHQPTQVELATSQAAEMVRARIESQFTMAVRRPRNEDLAHQKLMRDCRRPSFCASSRYRLPFKSGDSSKPVEGFTVRFAEACMRTWGNIDTNITVVFDDGKKRIVHVVATDLESNTTISAEAIVPLVVLRANPSGREVLGTRQNSNGQQRYLLAADEREATQLTASETSKAMRTAILRLIPGWLQDECLAEIEATMANADAKDPDSARRALCGAFDEIGVPADQIAEYLGHPLTALSPGELKTLRGLFAAVRDGETTWAAVMSSKAKAAPESDPNAALKDKLKAKKAKPAERVNAETGEVEDFTPARKSEPANPDNDGR